MVMKTMTNHEEMTTLHRRSEEVAVMTAIMHEPEPEPSITTTWEATAMQIQMHGFSSTTTDTDEDAEEEELAILAAAANAAKRVRCNSKMNEDITTAGATTTLRNIEEDGTYKTTTFANSSQSVSEHDSIQQQLQQEDQRNALISAISLFLVQAWNWLQHFLVTIIFLNLVHFTDRRREHSVVGEDIPSEVEVDGFEEYRSSANQVIVGSSQEEEIVDIDIDNQQNSDISEQTGNNMSPNTLSMQQEAVEQAVVATEKTMTMDMNTEVTASAEEVITASIKIDTVKQPEITVILAGDAEQESDQNDEESARRDSVDSCFSSEGNFGDTEDAPENKSSDDKSGNENENDEDQIAPTGAPVDNKEIAQRIISQVETMFSDEHLAKDGFLLKHVRRRSDGMVSLKLVAGLRKVKQISRDFNVVQEALKQSTKLQLNDEGTKIKRTQPLSSYLKAVPIKSKEKQDGKQKDNSSSNDENSQPIIENVSNNNKSASKTGNKENDNGKRGQNNRRNSNSNQNGYQQQSRRNSNANGNHHDNHSRKNSNASTTSSNGSRHSSFSKAAAPFVPSSHPPHQQHPADLLRSVYTMTAYSSSGEDCQSPQAGRRRGGSLPIAALKRHSAGAYLSPNSSPPRNGQSSAGGPFFTIGPNGGARPKSNSYCEGAGPSTMSPWLQRRKASASSRLSQGDLIITEVIRQPKGPDGTKGFQPGYRAMMIKERLQQRNSEVSA